MARHRRPPRLDAPPLTCQVVSTVLLDPLFEEVERGWVQASIVELPGVITVGRDGQEAEDLLRDALDEYVASLAQDGERLEIRVEDERIVLAER